jgi:hypothetical protein
MLKDFKHVNGKTLYKTHPTLRKTKDYEKLSNEEKSKLHCQKGIIYKKEMADINLEELKISACCD